MTLASRPRVLILIRHYEPAFRFGGPIRSVANLVDALNGEFDFNIVCLNRDFRETKPLDGIQKNTWQTRNGAQVCYVDANLLRPYPLLKAILSLDYDVIYVNSFFEPLFAILPASLMKFGLLRRRPIIVAPRGELSPGALALKSAKKNLVIRFHKLLGIYSTACWQATSELEASEIKKILGANIKMQVAPNLPGSNVAAEIKRAKKEAGALRVIFLSRISPKKNLHGLLDIVKKLRGKISLDIWGPIDDRVYWRECQLCFQLLPANITATYRGESRHELVPRVLSEGDVLALPTMGENYGHVIHEAFAAGCPVVISDRTPWRGLSAVGVGFDVNIETSEHFSKALQMFVDMKDDEYSSYAQRCRDYANMNSGGKLEIDASRQMFAAALKSRASIENEGGSGALLKMRKVVRYIGLYGVARTVAKIRGQYHMKAKVGFDGARWINSKCNDFEAVDRNVAIIGCGNFSFTTIAYYLSKREPTFLRVACDIDASRARSLCRSYGGAYAVTDWNHVLNDHKVRLVYIASNHATHAEYAIACIGAGKHVQIEKPHVVSTGQLVRLLAAMRANPESKVFLGFNRPRAKLFIRLQQLLGKEVGPLMINWFVAGHAIPDGHWYYKEEEGGRILGNLPHWTDLTLHLVGLKNAFPCKIFPAASPGARSEFALSVIFADGSTASITFSAKGESFEGVREVLNVHKGNVLANLTDFKVLTVDRTETKSRTELWHRDHGHGANVVNSLTGARAKEELGEDVNYVGATGRFFLAIREALESGRVTTVNDDFA